MFSRNTHAIGLAEFRQFEKRFPLTGIGIGPFGNLVGTQRAAMLNEDTRTDTIAENGERLGGIDLVTTCHRIHEIGRHQTMHGVAEAKLLCQRHETLGALLDDAAAGDQVEACHRNLNGIAADIGKRVQIAFECGQFAVVRAGIEAGTYKIAHVVISRAKKVIRGRATAQRVVPHGNRSGRSI